MLRVCYVLSAGNSDSGTGRVDSQEIIDYTMYAKEKGCFMTGTEDMSVEYINVVEDV